MNILATRDPTDGRITVLAYHMDDYDVDTHNTGSALPPREIRVTVGRLDRPPCRVCHYRLDAEHSSTFDAWKRADKPTRNRLERAPR